MKTKNLVVFGSFFTIDMVNMTVMQTCRTLIPDKFYYYVNI